MMTVKQVRKIARQSAIEIHGAVFIVPGADPQYIRLVKGDFLLQIAHLDPETQINAEKTDGILWIN
jgi:hypothetical protein